MEVVRILSSNRGLRRSVIFASWGAEEQGIFGSWEFAEEYRHVLMDRTVAYVNMDLCTCGPILYAAASPLIGHKIIQVTKQIKV